MTGTPTLTGVPVSIIGPVAVAVMIGELIRMAAGVSVIELAPTWNVIMTLALSEMLIPASTDTRGHLTTGNAKFYKKQIEELLQSAPQRAM